MPTYAGPGISQRHLKRWCFCCCCMQKHIFPSFLKQGLFLCFTLSQELYLVIGIFAILPGKSSRATRTQAGVRFDQGCHEPPHMCSGRDAFSQQPCFPWPRALTGARLGTGCQTLLFLVCSHDRDTAVELRPHPAVGVGLCFSQKMCA